MFKAISRWGSQVRSSLGMGFISNIFSSKSRSKYGEMSEDTEEIFCDAHEEPFTDDEHDHTPVIETKEPPKSKSKKSKVKSKRKSKSKRNDKADANGTDKTTVDLEIAEDKTDTRNPDVENKDTNSELEIQDTNLTSLVDVHKPEQNVSGSKQNPEDDSSVKENVEFILVDVTSSGDVESSQQTKDDVNVESESSSCDNGDSENDKTDNDDNDGDGDVDKSDGSKSDAESVYEDSEQKSKQEHSDEEHDHHHIDHDDTKQIVKPSTSNDTDKEKNGMPKSSSSASIFKKVHRRVNSYTQRQYAKFDNTHDDENDNSIVVTEIDITDVEKTNSKDVPSDNIDTDLDEFDVGFEKGKKKKKKVSLLRFFSGFFRRTNK